MFVSIRESDSIWQRHKHNSEQGEAKSMCNIRCGKVTETETCTFVYGNLVCVGVHTYTIGCICSFSSALAQNGYDRPVCCLPRIIAKGLPEVSPAGDA